MSESSTDVFESLESLYLKTLRNFRVFIKREGAAPPSWQSNSTFSHLKKLTIGECPSMKNLFSLDMLPNLTNLEVIKVDECHQMEEIIAKDDMHHPSPIEALKLSNLPELKSIFHGALICDSLEEILVVNCPKLKRIPLSHSNGLPPLRKIQAYPEEWWGSVEWGSDSNSKNALQPLCVFQESLY
uniref:Disease resistance protein At4g27190-like leucine-rich repeats domain-containing protein n=1 Tax=Salix viminalis TaxID=40686 RepID=A0A6N2MW25_SALVM